MIEADKLLLLGARLTTEVIGPLMKSFVGKDEIIDLLAIALVAGENIFLHGPPGTAKSALVHELCRRLQGKSFDYLLTRFTEPNELFGPFDIRRLRDGELVTNTEGMLPEASLVFLDELLNANSAILNSLLMTLNERVFRRGRETRDLPVVSFIGASNNLPEDEALRALFDRFILRVRCDNVAPDRLPEVLEAGWNLQLKKEILSTLSFDDLRALQNLYGEMSLEGVRPGLVDLIGRIRTAGIAVSDRRAVRLQRVVAASAIICGRLEVIPADFWVLKHIWDTEEQQEPLRSIVQSYVDAIPATRGDHPRARLNDEADPEALARDLEDITSLVAKSEISPVESTRARDRLALLEARVSWVKDNAKKAALVELVSALWKKFPIAPVNSG